MSSKVNIVIDFDNQVHIYMGTGRTIMEVGEILQSVVDKMTGGDYKIDIEGISHGTDS